MQIGGSVITAVETTKLTISKNTPEIGRNADI